MKSFLYYGLVLDYEIVRGMCAVKLMAKATRRKDFDIVIPSPKRVVSIKLEIDLIEEIDRLWRSLGYTSRSEFIREAILYYMQVAKQLVDLRNKEKQTLISVNNIDLENTEDQGENSFRGKESYIVVDTMTDIA